jgi:hypothetical protein
MNMSDYPTLHLDINKSNGIVFFTVCIRNASYTIQTAFLLRILFWQGYLLEFNTLLTLTPFVIRNKNIRLISVIVSFFLFIKK